MDARKTSNKSKNSVRNWLWSKENTSSTKSYQRNLSSDKQMNCKRSITLWGKWSRARKIIKWRLKCSSKRIRNVSIRIGSLLQTCKGCKEILSQLWRSMKNTSYRRHSFKNERSNIMSFRVNIERNLKRSNLIGKELRSRKSSFWGRFRKLSHNLSKSWKGAKISLRANFIISGGNKKGRSMKWRKKWQNCQIKVTLTPDSMKDSRERTLT